MTPVLCNCDVTNISDYNVTTIARCLLPGLTVHKWIKEVEKIIIEKSLQQIHNFPDSLDQYVNNII